MTERSDLAWAAGLFEGEGCFSAKRRKQGMIQLSAVITSTDLEVLETFNRVIGEGHICGPFDLKNPRWRPAYHWTANGEAVVRVYDKLEPWLHSRRRERFVELLATRRQHESERAERLSAAARRGAATRARRREAA